MALPASGTISLDDVQTEFGGSNPIAITEYYGVDAGVPASGTISLSDFYGTSAIPDSVYNDSGYTFKPAATGDFTFLDLSGKTWAAGDKCYVWFISDDPFTFMDVNSFNSSAEITSANMRMYIRTLQSGDTTFSTNGLTSTTGRSMIAVWLIIDSTAGTIYYNNGTVLESAETESPETLSTGFLTYADVFTFGYMENIAFFTNDPSGDTLVNQVNSESVYKMAGNLVHKGVLEDTGSGIVPSGSWTWTDTTNGGSGGNVSIFATVT